ncbi:LysM peptidoglycan-binding domain-containing protein [Actinotalea sp. AC32]|nr:LysM peptidoglycan-binding domain-containing protein [Actinotalea sp. AC32]
MSTTRDDAAGTPVVARSARTAAGRSGHGAAGRGAPGHGPAGHGPAGHGAGGLRLTRRGRVAVTVLAVGLAGAVGMTAQSAAARGPAAPVPVVAHVVEPGETLWEIAARTAEPGQDVRDVVADLTELNGLPDVALEAGQQLLVPVR